MKRFVNYLKNGTGRGLIPVLIFTLLLSGFVGYALFAFLKFYISATGQQLPPTSALMLQFLLPVALCFFITLWASFGFQNLWAYLFKKACRFQLNKGTVARVSMTTMILFWVLAIASVFTNFGVKLWIVLDYFSKSVLAMLGRIVLTTPWLLVPAVIITFAIIWSIIPALLGMIALIFVREKGKLVSPKAPVKLTAVPAKQETKKVVKVAVKQKAKTKTKKKKA